MDKLGSIAVVFVIAVLAISLYLNYSDASVLENCCKEVTGQVVDKYRIKSKGHRVRYQYTIDGELYEKTEPVKGTSNLSKLIVGGDVTLKVGCEKHHVSAILFE